MYFIHILIFGNVFGTLIVHLLPYPFITSLLWSLHVSIERINISINSYQVVSSIAPPILGSLADQTGRRPVCIISFILYVLRSKLGTCSSE